MLNVSIPRRLGPVRVDVRTAFGDLLLQETTEAELSVTAWRDAGPREARPGDLVTVSEEARESLGKRQVALERPERKTPGDVKTQIIRLVIEKMTGRKIKMVSPEDLVCAKECEGAGEGERRTEKGSAEPREGDPFRCGGHHDANLHGRAEPAAPDGGCPEGSAGDPL